MSLILDALNRANQERNEDSNNPYLQTPSINASSERHPLKRWGFECLLAIIVIVACYYFFQQSNQQNTVALPAVATINNNSSDHQDTANNIVESIPLQSKQTEQLITELLTTEHLITEQFAIDKNDLSTAEKSIAVKDQPENSEQDTAAINSLYQQQTKQAVIQSPSQAEPKIIATPKKTITEVIEPADDNGLSILESIPLLAEFSTRFKQSVPSIEYSTHIYSEEGGVVILNGKTCKVGTELAPGLRVIAILKNSLVLDYNGRQFRLQALNSWINF